MVDGMQPALSERSQRRRTLREDALNLPNLLTMARIVVIPLVLTLLDRGGPRDCFWAAVIFALAAVTDFLDGYFARTRGLVSVLGKFLDPLADKLIVMATLVWMVPMGRIAPWVVVLLLGRDISITALRSIAASEGVVIAAGESGKAKTALQMVGIVLLMLGYPYQMSFIVFDLGVVDLVRAGRWLIYISLVYSLLSAAQYVGLFASAIEARGGRKPTAP
ncbi:MAG TPA: CDP-diacylglycerol--glycerol-3-phosphate 3-phosphatidyltransferase [Polyangiaceae bacterium]|jgi:CDP-diacylglycerol--glycerol-3-phosphate 3-phosphatidyltransferase